MVKVLLEILNLYPNKLSALSSMKVIKLLLINCGLLNPLFMCIGERYASSLL